ncbi:dihydrofolate reductase family protein [Actinomadura sp. CNU-125]|uniref:dihydrofolate reductase family protein n=1 Tax=Actinomadura sp. CNU-125 TaxID=1904961 RepID=UPI0021CCCDCE|nr:dihydrofolate reductase family protein [Actinomadura sp. CNU-125]
MRARRGGPPAPIVVVSRSLDFDWTLPLFTEAETPTVVVTTERARAHVPSGIRAVVAGEADIDLPEAVRLLHGELGPRLLCEGGPGLATALLRASLVDELCLNIAPALHGPRTPLLTGLPAEIPVDPAAVYLDEGVLFVRYRVARV